MTNFTFTPQGNNQYSGNLVIDGGTTTISRSGALFSGILSVSYAKLVDKQAQIALSGKNTVISIGYDGTMEADGGTGITLIKENVIGTNDYISLHDGGELDYVGKAGVTDTFTAPVLVGSMEEPATLSLKGGGTLEIDGSEFGTNFYSLYIDGNFTSANGTNLSTTFGMYAAPGSRVATLDSNKVTITVASGNPCIIDGLLQIDAPFGLPDTSSYGILVLNCDTLDFDGTFEVAINGSASGVNDLLIVNRVLDLGSGSSLDVIANNPPTLGYPASWTIITSTGGAINDFGYSNAGSDGGLLDEPNCPSNGDYSLYGSGFGTGTGGQTKCMGSRMSAAGARVGMGAYAFTGSISGLSANGP